MKIKMLRIHIDMAIHFMCLQDIGYLPMECDDFQTRPKKELTRIRPSDGNVISLMPTVPH